MADAKITISVDGGEIATDVFRSVATEAEKVGPAIGKIGPAAESAKSGTAGMVEQLRGFDGILASMGIHIGPEIKAIGELGATGGATATSLGLLGTAGLAVGAAIGGWKIGRAIADFFDLDAAIGAATAKLFGWGDAAAEAAGARMDLLNRLATQVSGLGSNAAQSAQALAGWHNEIAKVKAAGELDSLTKDLASQNFEVKELAARYHVSVEALQVFTRETKASADAETAASELTKAHNAAKLDGLREEIATRKEAAKVESMSLAEATKLWDEYAAARISHGGTANQIAIADIDRWASDLTAKMVKAGADTEEFYAGLAAVSTEKMAAVGVDWDFLRANSQETLEELAKNARATYNQMIEGSQHFSREVLDEQLAKVHAADDAARGMGQSYKDAFDAAAEKARTLTDDIAKVAAAAAKAKAAMMAMGSSFTYDLTTQAGVEQYRKMNTGMDISWSNDQLIAFATQGGTLQQLLQMGVIHMRAFANGVENFEGGWAMVGERGPEPMYVPPGASIFPHGSSVGGSPTVNISVNFNGDVVADRQQFEAMVKDVFVKVARQTRQLPA